MSDTPKAQPISAGKLRSALSAITRQMPEDQYNFQYIARLAAQPARSTALAGSAYLEHGLRTAITNYLRNTLSEAEQERLFASDAAPLATFADRINLAFALGILGNDSRSDFNAIRLIRNVFAHSVIDVEFNLTTIATAIEALHVFKRPDFPQSMNVPGPPKTQFIFAIAYYYLRLWIAAPGRPNIEFNLLEWKPTEQWPQAYSQKFA